MKRPLLVWLVFAACAAVGCGVLAWFTREMLRLDHESTEARRLAAVEENIRLALWRMDSALASIHGLEASRPAQDYAPFFRSAAAFQSGTLTPVAPGAVLLPSPLLGYAPPFVRLHFQVAGDQSVSSPQAPAADYRSAALAAGVMPERFTRAETTLAELQARLQGRDLATLLPPAPAAPFSAHAVAAKEAEDKDYGSLFLRKIRADESRADAPADEFTRQLPAPTAQPPPARSEEIVQRSKNEAEQRERALTRELTLTYNQEVAGNALPQTPIVLGEAAPSAPISGIVGGSRAQDPRGDNEGQAAFPVTLADDATSLPASPSPAAAVAVSERSQAEAELAEPAEQAQAKGVARPDSIGTLQAVWIDSELLLARRAVFDGTDVVQGAWLDWPELRAWLLSRVSDLLPDARLAAVAPNGEVAPVDAARRLAFLPVQLVPGLVTIERSTLPSPLRISVTIAWVGAAVGLVALALLLRGTIRLSERRGAFVSAVTHELRTPLTTFRMYTEMLASGMVKDEAKRQGYVNTLHQESARLSHLVENVLSYARLERGRAAARVEDTTPGDLLGRIEERLRQRAAQGGLTVQVEFAGDAADRALRVDTTAVEQVLFNLVDNATKYGRPKDGGGEIRVSVEAVTPKRLAIRVGDQGPGLTAAARKRLFQPFSKSATEAAHSQPGVGLGLALCRRLARDELHGDLVLERTGPEGTVFRLELPTR